MKLDARLIGLLAMLVWGMGKRSTARASRPAAPRPPPPSSPRPTPSSSTPTPVPEPSRAVVWPVPAGKMPTAPRLRFGYQRSPSHRHQGIDIVAPEGSSVLAPIAGEVVHVNEVYQPGFSGYGKAVVLKVDASPWTGDAPGAAPLWLLFAHLQRTEVKKGDRVAAGARLGFTGRTKFTREDHTAMFDESGAHVHLEVSSRPYPQDSEAATRLDPVMVWEQLNK